MIMAADEILKTLDLQLVPPNLAALGVKRIGDPDNADLGTIWSTPYPVITRYKQWCQLVNLKPFGGGHLLGQQNEPGLITSGFRDELIEGRKHSPHLYALALDIFVGDLHRQLAVAPAALGFFSRIGIYPDNGFIHLDLVPQSWMDRFSKKRFWCRVDGEYESFDQWPDMMDHLAA